MKIDTSEIDLDEFSDLQDKAKELYPDSYHMSLDDLLVKMLTELATLRKIVKDQYSDDETDT